MRLFMQDGRKLGLLSVWQKKYGQRKHLLKVQWKRMKTVCCSLLAHLAIEVPGVDGSNEWLEAVDDAVYGTLK